ncbi:hypothetical protein BH23CHL8_BH23CHL8_17660 [soil metagenome]
MRAMFVRGDRTRRGLGRRILEACEEAARGEGFGDLTLMSTLPGEPLYLRFGFFPRERVPIRMPDGVVSKASWTSRSASHSGSGRPGWPQPSEMAKPTSRP